MIDDEYLIAIQPEYHADFKAAMMEYSYAGCTGRWLVYRCAVPAGTLPPALPCRHLLLPQRIADSTSPMAAILASQQYQGVEIVPEMKQSGYFGRLVQGISPVGITFYMHTVAQVVAGLVDNWPEESGQSAGSLIDWQESLDRAILRLLGKYVEDGELGLPESPELTHDIARLRALHTWLGEVQAAHTPQEAAAVIRQAKRRES